MIIFVHMINRVKNIVFTILNKEKRGPITPTQFIDSCIRNQNKIFSDYFDSTFMRQKNRSARGLANDSVKLYEQRLANFYKPAEISLLSGKFALPDDYYFIDRRGVQTKDSEGIYTDVDMMKMSSFKRETASGTFPIGVMINGSIQVKPSGVSTIHIDYYAKPKDPNWTYTVVDEVSYFNPNSDSFQDFEIHPSEENELIIGILSDFGIIKRETDVTQLINGIKQAEENGRSRVL